MSLDRFLARTLEQDARNRVRAPETTKLADLLTAWSESQADPQKHAALGLVAGTVGDWSRRGYNLGGPEILVVIEAALKAAGVRL